MLTARAARSSCLASAPRRGDGVPGERNHIRQQITTAAQSSHALQRLGRIAHRYEGMGLAGPCDGCPVAHAARADRRRRPRRHVGHDGDGREPRRLRHHRPERHAAHPGGHPDPNSPAQELLGTLGERIAAFNDAVEYGVRAQLSSRGVSEEGIAEALRVIRGGATHHEGASPRVPRPSPAAPAAAPSGPATAGSILMTSSVPEVPDDLDRRG